MLQNQIGKQCGQALDVGVSTLSIGGNIGNYIREDLQFAGLPFDWWRRSQDRAGWRAAVECLLQSA